MKQLISFFLRHVPRKYLQLFSHVVLKVVSVFFIGSKVECPVCTHRFRKFLPYGRKARENALCPNCLSLERHRLIWLFLHEKTSFFEKEQDVLHIAPELCFIERFEAVHKDRYITADLESPLAKIKLDIHRMPLDSSSFDVVFCNHVMEHVENDYQAMGEIYRVLRPGGFAIVQIPLFHPLPDSTYEDASITDPAEREKHFGQDDHVRLYGKDYADRLRSVGFDVVEDPFVMQMPAADQQRYALPTDEMIFFCKK